MVNEVNFVGFEGVNRLNRLPLDSPLIVMYKEFCYTKIHPARKSRPILSEVTPKNNVKMQQAKNSSGLIRFFATVKCLNL